MPTTRAQEAFVDWFRQASPYIHAHRGRTFVVSFGGEAVADTAFPNLVHDLAILHGLGIRLVLVHGARPQIEERLKLRGAQIRYIAGLRVTDDPALACVKEAAGAVRVEVEALFSMGLTNSPMANARLRVTSGNFVTARPVGVREGVDYLHTGEVRRVDAEAIRGDLDAGMIVLVPPLGYSPTGEVFNLHAADVAGAVASAIGADKLIALVEGKGLTDRRGRPIANLTPREVDALLAKSKALAEDLAQQLANGAACCRAGVKRVHVLGRALDGVLLRELFTREGAGTLIAGEPAEETRAATIDDVGGILELIRPLEESGALVRRSRELLETEIGRFTVVQREGMVIACAALYPYPAERMAELACVAVHPDYRGDGRGDALLAHMERLAAAHGIDRLFVLTTQTAHWFLERGFAPAALPQLPAQKREFYNWRRNSKVFVKAL
jgi:amino-acid N-acetyltransferase